MPAIKWNRWWQRELARVWKVMRILLLRPHSQNSFPSLPVHRSLGMLDSEILAQPEGTPPPSLLYLKMLIKDDSDG